MAVITMVHRYVRRKFIVVLDRYSVHRKAVRLLQDQHPDRFEVAWLPAYAPELNPVEMVWNHTKYADLPNFILEDMYHLRQSVAASIEDTLTQPDLLRSFFNYSELEL